MQTTISNQWTGSEVGIYKPSDYAPLVDIYNRLNLPAFEPDKRLSFLTQTLELDPNLVKRIIRDKGNRASALMFLEELVETLHDLNHVRL